MKVVFSENARKYLRSARKKDHILYIRIIKTIEKFVSDQSYPSLRLHKLTGNMHDMWSMSVNKSIRVVFAWEEDGIYVTHIGTHEQVYK